MFHGRKILKPLDLRFDNNSLERAHPTTEYVLALQNAMLQKNFETKTKVTEMYNRYRACYTDLNELEFRLEVVNEALSMSSPDKGLDGIPDQFLASSAEELSFHVYKLFSSIATSSDYTIEWKTSYIRPV